MWYSIEALFKCEVIDDREEDVLFDRRIFLINVDKEKEVNEKAIKISKKSEVDYKNYENNDVKWEFIKILDVQDLCETEIYDGIEVFSRLFYGDNEKK